MRSWRRTEVSQLGGGLQDLCAGSEGGMVVELVTDRIGTGEGMEVVGRLIGSADGAWAPPLPSPPRRMRRARK